MVSGAIGPLRRMAEVGIAEGRVAQQPVAAFVADVRMDSPLVVGVVLAVVMGDYSIGDGRDAQSHLVQSCSEKRVVEQTEFVGNAAGGTEGRAAHNVSVSLQEIPLAVKGVPGGVLSKPAALHRGETGRSNVAHR
ncbi:hypothetical protein [Candidatus Methylomirabilis limnetica]|uniref:hypothetical protein n=1 Tax=Candidatus Methylomirabilis limnetica TaxID=2033718 RepID=UPI00137B2F5A|nr:hypothetical protein [Candidatus Methylomirabilis limnetica]